MLNPSETLPSRLPDVKPVDEDVAGAVGGDADGQVVAQGVDHPRPAPQRRSR